MTASEPDVRFDPPLHVDRWKLDITNNLDLRDEFTLDASAQTFDMTLAIDAEAYDRLLYGVMPEPTYTVEMSCDLNPWRREPTDVRTRLRKWRDCLIWSFRRRILRRKLVEHVTCTVPNCRLSAEPLPPEN